VGTIFFFFFGFDEAIRARFADADDLDARRQFFFLRNSVRDLSFFVWLGYCLIMESSPLQGTLGKHLVGIKVITSEGNRLSFFQALVRTSTKIFSYFALGLGFIWGAFTKEKQGWHDKMAKAYVICK
jgi:uncharacterized RDD family membrane protein YckC